MKWKFGILAGVALSAMVPAQAQAQNTAGASGPEERDEAQGSAQILISDIVVSARKKGAAERAQDVPIALTALSGEQIEATFVKSLTDVGLTMPNVRLDTAGAFAGTQNFAIRGMGFNSTIASVEPTVGVFVDGIYLGANLGGSPDAYDLESVEVLRGPQGTLFGRNVTAGAVVMRSRRPTGEFGGSARLGVGSGGRKMIGFGIEGPLGETVAAKIYTQYSNRSGDWDLICPKLDPALTLGCPGLNGRKHFGREETLFMRPIVRFRPSADVDITFIGEYGTLKGDGTPSRVLNDPLSPTTFNSPVGREPRGGAEKLSINYVGYTDIVWYQGALEATWDVGPGIITSITGFRDVDYDSAGESDGTPLDISRGGNAMKQHQFSQELRFAGQAFDGKFDYTIGAYYFEQSVNQLYSIRFFGPSNQRSQGKLDHKSWSVFAQGDFEFAPGAFLTLGGRYTWEKKTPLIARTVDCTLPPSQNQALFPFTCNLQPLTPRFKTWSNFTPKLGLSWKATPDVLVYASWTKGFRSGGYNIRTTGTVATESPGPYDPEVAKALELGVKADLFDGRARINAAIFQNRFTGLQRTVNEGPRNFITNAANARVEGAELEVTLLPVDTLALTANVGYLDARYRNYLLPLSNGTVLDLSGKQMIRAPKWSYTLAATHDLSLGSAGDLSSRVSYSHNGKTPMNDAGTYFTPGFNLLDASLSWSPAGRNDIKLSIWGKNLTNETYAVTGTVVRPVFTILYQSLPRHFGAEFSYRF